jgi:hypothetical protein
MKNPQNIPEEANNVYARILHSKKDPSCPIVRRLIGPIRHREEFLAGVILTSRKRLNGNPCRTPILGRRTPINPPFFFIRNYVTNDYIALRINICLTSHMLFSTPFFSWLLAVHVPH